MRASSHRIVPLRKLARFPAGAKVAIGPIRSSNDSIPATGAWTLKLKTGASSGVSQSRLKIKERHNRR
jgi:hypothetical protein